MESLQVPRPAWMTEDLVLLEEQARRFFASELVPHVENWTADGIMERAAWDKLGAAGLLCAGIPEEYGGAGGTFAHEAVINREFALAGLDAIGAPLHSGIVAPYILNYGTEEQKKKWLPRLATGELIGAIAMSEPGTGSDLQGVRTSAKKSGNGYVLNGSKTFITNGQHANLIIVVAKTDPGERRQGHLADGGRDRRCAGLPPRPQAEQARHGLGRHLGTVLRGCEAAGRRPARHRRGPGLHPAHERIAAGAADRLDRRDRHDASARCA